ncbi:heme ABC exporter ATP-binding protein CcmA [Roseococcus suduntuyensis]|uniref:Heme exporter protein A n=1 Tax=Roseococcus suduntuyensis TaxID=455361 RepID=A0A840A8W4_9PROT|nr:heme ABC exporter ATP-binding protein CcmA [Roseococcus suduntuyensis]MBB3896953.1 heme exporter protein A [Roseococcus suduntuyensis]
MEAALFTAQDLACWRAERLVFAEISFTLAPGEALLLTGANGAGKSSLLRVLAGLLPAAEGKLLWNNEDALADRVTHGARLRYLGHQDALKPALSAAENLGFYARLHGGDVPAALEALDLLPLADLPARVLSSGQKRRLALARLALAPCGLWLLDEPTVGLDTASVARLGPLLAAHRARGGMVIAATHLPLPLPDARELRL